MEADVFSCVGEDPMEVGAYSWVLVPLVGKESKGALKTMWGHR